MIQGWLSSGNESHKTIDVLCLCHAQKVQKHVGAAVDEMFNRGERIVASFLKDNHTLTRGPHSSYIRTRYTHMHTLDAPSAHTKTL